MGHARTKQYMSTEHARASKIAAREAQHALMRDSEHGTHLLKTVFLENRGLQVSYDMNHIILHSTFHITFHITKCFSQMHALVENIDHVLGELGLREVDIRLEECGGWGLTPGVQG